MNYTKSCLGKVNATTPADTLETLADADEMVKVDSLVQEFLSAQSLKVLPQGPFGDAVTQFVSKDDKHAMELFVSEHLTGQVRQMLGLESDDENLDSAMEIYKTRVEQELASGVKQTFEQRKRVLRPKPDQWDSDFDGNWEDEPDAWTFEGDDSLTTPAPSGGRGKSKATTQHQDEDLLDDDEEPPVKKTTTRKATTRTTKAAATKKAPVKKAPARGRGRKAVQESEEEEEEDVVMESDEEPAPAPPPKTRKAPARSAAKTTTSTRGSARTRQTKLDFSQSQKNTQKAVEISDDEISDDDAFEPAPVASRTRKR